MSTPLSRLTDHGVLMVNGHFDYGNGYHGSVYLNPHKLFQYPSTIWRFAQDVIDKLPSEITMSVEVVAGPVLGGALLGHTLVGLLDGRRPLQQAALEFAPIATDAQGALELRPFYQQVVRGRRVLLVDDVRNTGKTFERVKALVEAAGGTVIGTVEIVDRLESVVDLGVPNIALVDYPAPENVAAEACPQCAQGVPVTTF